jgi:hypothetical protein
MAQPGFMGGFFAPFKRTKPDAAPDEYGYVNPLEGLGPIDRYKYLNKYQPETIMSLAAGLLQGTDKGMAEGFANAGQAMGDYRAIDQKRQDRQQTQNLTMQYLHDQFPDLSEADLQAAARNPEILTHLLSPKVTGTDDIQEYNFALSQGFKGSFIDFKLSQIKAGVAPNLGPIPSGWRLGADGQTLEPIPGGPADPTRKDVIKAGQKDVATETVVSAAAAARKAAAGRPIGPYFQAEIAKWFQTSDAAETQRQVNVLKAQASIENITQMRNASPTGAAMGPPSDKDMQILADKAGALDPASPNFDTAVDDYERMLLKTIHGPAEGERIYQSTREQKGGLPTVRSQADFDRLPSGSHYIDADDGVVYKKP